MKQPKYFDPENLPKFAEALAEKKPIADIESWEFESEIVGNMAESFYPEMLPKRKRRSSWPRSPNQTASTEHGLIV